MSNGAPTVVSPSTEDPVVTGATQLIGGPVGRRALVPTRTWLTPTLVLILFTLATCFLGWAQKAPCRDPARWQHEYQYTRMCYSDVAALYFSEGLVDGKHPYIDHDVEYPVVIGGLMQVGAWVADWFPDSQHAERFFDITALMLTAAAVALVVTTSWTAGRRRPWDAAMVALAPTLLLHAFTNWDLAATAFVAGGLYAWARRRPGWAGFWLGLGVATKLYPLVFLVPLFALCWRSGRLRAFLGTAFAMAGTVVLAYVPMLLFTPVYGDTADGGRGVVAPSAWTTLREGGGLSDVRRSLAGIPIIGTGVAHPQGTCEPHNGLLRFFDLNRTRPADFDSLYFAFQRNTGRNLSEFGDTCASPHPLNLLVAMAVIMLFIAVAVLAVLAPRRPRLPQLLFLTLAGFVLVNKVYSPQYVIWLLPLAVLARPRWGAFLAWQAAEVALLVTRFAYFIGLDKAGQGLSTVHGDGYRWFETAVLFRGAALVMLMAFVVRDILKPELDVVRHYGDDDPAGGVLDGAPDRHEPSPVRGSPSAVPGQSGPRAQPTTP